MRPPLRTRAALQQAQPSPPQGVVAPPRGVMAPETLESFEEGNYTLRFARTVAEVESALRLRFEVFNRELGEGLEHSWSSGLDRDRFDDICHHLLLCERSTGALVGTYRLQTAEQAVAGAGLYCDGEFDLAPLAHIVQQGVELGRACIVREHRNGSALFALWRGLAAFMTWSEKRYMFGCCSLTSQDPGAGLALWESLREQGFVASDMRVSVRPDYACEGPAAARAPKLPRLFRTYLRYGALVCSPPALDREFGTIDYLVVLDTSALPTRMWRLFFTGLRRSRPRSGA